MSVGYEPRGFHDENPYAPVGEHDHDHDDHDSADMHKYINTEANVDDMADLAAATYEPHDDPSPFNTSDSPALELGPVAPPNVDPANVPLREPSLDLLDGTSATQHSLTRSRPIAKPVRAAYKNEAGLFECRWTGCEEDVKTFARKCEWSKHMDKHERPYVCTVKGCEKIQGFTYSGGLLRHEREVHGKHGGPKKAFHCPHANCKRNAGKGFSRLENLQEHLRRVHTTSAGSGATASTRPATLAPAPTLDEDTTANAGHDGHDSASDVASAAFAVMTGMAAAAAAAHAHAEDSVTPPPTLLAGDGGEVATGGDDTNETPSHKRKREVDDTGRDDDDGSKRQQQDNELKAEEEEDDDEEEEQQKRRQRRQRRREEMERLQRENDGLRRQLQEQVRLTNDMRDQLRAMQAAINQTLGVPQAPVL